MKQKNENPFRENEENKNRKANFDDQLLYNLLFSGKISLKEYLAQLNRKA